MNLQGKSFLTTARTVFFLRCAWGLWLALSPHVGPPPPPGPYDKIEHFTGFYVQAAMALVAFPGSARWKLFVGLTAFGGLVEILQAMPTFLRSRANLPT